MEQKLFDATGEKKGEKMRKRVLAVITAVAMLLFTQVGFAFAGETSETSINTLEAFKAELAELQKENPNIDCDSMETKELMQKTDVDVIDAFVEEKMEMIGEEFSSEFTGGQERIDLGDGCYVEVNPKEQNTPSLYASTPGATTLWKDYGARKFTSTFEGNLLVAAFNLNMCNHYTLGSTGITPRYVEAWGNGGGLATVAKGSVYEPKRSAKVGETASSNCIFTVTVSTGGKNLQKSFKMYNYVKCSEIDKTGKQVKVVQSWKGDYL